MARLHIIVIGIGFALVLVFWIVKKQQADVPPAEEHADTVEGQYELVFKELDPLVQQLTVAPEHEKGAIASFIAGQFGHDDGIVALIRYRQPAMKRVFERLLKSGNWFIRSQALYGLKMTGDHSAVDQVLALMSADEDFRVREMAVNALTHMGGDPAVLDAMRRALEKEEDRFVAATLEAGIRHLRADSRSFPAWQEDLVGPEGARRVEVRFGSVYGELAFVEEDYRPVQPPVADSFDWPVSGYSDSLLGIPPHIHFAGDHVGEDVGWFRDGCSVYAVANGVVRIIYGAGNNWGFLVGVEHRLPSGRYVSSIYGHGAFDILVKAGEVVRKGQKIMTAGLSCSVENGGYSAHIHFGLSWGPIRRPAGYFVGLVLQTDLGDEVSESEVVDLSYHSELTNQKGWPQLLAVVRHPDGRKEEIVFPGEENPELETSWIKGFTPVRKGWISPREFISARRSL